MNTEITIRKVKPEEAKALAKLSAAMFSDTYAHLNDPLDMQLYVEENFNPEKIHQELINPDTYCFYAIKNSIPVGCSKLILHQNHASFTGIKTAELSRLYVDKAYHNQKIGAALMQFAIDFSLKNQAEKLWLGVWEKNNKALDFYRKWGFIKIETLQFKLGNDVQEDWLMEKNLS